MFSNSNQDPACIDNGICYISNIQTRCVITCLFIVILSIRSNMFDIYCTSRYMFVPVECGQLSQSKDFKLT